MNFPVFESGKPITELEQETGTTSMFFQAPPTPLPRYHDGREEAIAAEVQRRVLQITNPKLAAAIAAEERARRTR